MPTLIGAIFSLSLTSLIVSAGLYPTSKYYALIGYRTTFTKLNYTIALTQSLALTQQQNFKICPRHLKEQNWQDGWQILDQNNQIIKTIALNSSAIIDFKAFTQAPCLTINPNGMSYNNGHFQYMARGLLYTIKGKLIFNQGLRTYIIDEFSY